MYLGIRIYSRTVRTAHRVLPLLVDCSTLQFLAVNQIIFLSIWMSKSELVRFSCAALGQRFTERKMVGLIGLEPMTPALSRRCSNQLSYATVEVVEPDGVEPTTSCLQSRRSTN